MLHAPGVAGRERFGSQTGSANDPSVFRASSPQDLDNNVGK